MLYFCIALQIYMWDDFYYGCSSFSEAGDFFNRCGLYQRKPIGTWVINNNIYICLSNAGWGILDEASTSHYNCIFHTWQVSAISCTFNTILWISSIISEVVTSTGRAERGSHDPLQIQKPIA